jgi:predicted GNAT family acetyltransferase
MPETTVVDVPEAERFEIRVDGELAGFEQYRRRGSLIAFIHTEIDPRFEGQGLGKELVRTVLDTARKGALEVLPFCPFVRGYIEKHPEYLDLVPESQREQFDLPVRV